MGLISTFKDIAKNETVRRSRLPGLVRDMREDLVDHRRKNLAAESPAVDSDMSKSDFVSSYKTLQNMSLISFAYVIGLSAYIGSGHGTNSFVTLICLLIIGSLWHFSYCVRALRARRVAENWSERNQPLSLSYSEFFDEALGDPLIFMPFTRPVVFLSDKIKSTKGD